MDNYQPPNEHCPWPTVEENEPERMKARHLRLLVTSLEQEARREPAADASLLTDQPPLPVGLRRPKEGLPLR